MIEIIATFLMIAIIVFAVVKKYNAQTAFFAVSIVALLIWTFATGKSCAAEAEATGNLLADVFIFSQRLRDRFQEQCSSVDQSLVM